MNVFIDTSALLAVLDRDDSHHEAARASWAKLLEAGTVLVSHNYVLVETSALVLRRLGIEALRLFESDVVPILRIVWVTREVHEAAAAALLVANRRDLSLVDCASFDVLRRTGLRTVFAFDRHFKEFGFALIAT